MIFKDGKEVKKVEGVPVGKEDREFYLFFFFDSIVGRLGRGAVRGLFGLNMYADFTLRVVEILRVMNERQREKERLDAV